MLNIDYWDQKLPFCNRPIFPRLGAPLIARDDKLCVMLILLNVLVGLIFMFVLKALVKRSHSSRVLHEHMGWIVK